MENDREQSDHTNAIEEAQVAHHTTAECPVESSNSPTSFNTKNAPATEVAFSNNPTAPSPLTLASDLKDRSSSRGEHVPEGAITVTRTQLKVTEQGTYLSVPVSNAVRSLSCCDEEAFDDGYDSDGQLGPFYDAIAICYHLKTMRKKYQDW